MEPHPSAAMTYTSDMLTVREVTAPHAPSEKPLPMVTTHDPLLIGQSAATAASLVPLHIITGIEKLTGASIQDMSVSTQTPTSKHDLPKVTKPMKWSRVLNKLVEIAPTAELETVPQTHLTLWIPMLLSRI